MARPTLTFSKGSRGPISLSARFGIISRIVGRPQMVECPIFVYGDDYYELVYEYTGGYYSSTLVEKQKIGLSDRIRPHFRGRLGAFNKLSSFTRQPALEVKSWGDGAVDDIAKFPVLPDDIVHHFLSTRRAAFDKSIAEEYVNRLMKPDFGGPYIISAYGNSISYDSAIAIKTWSYSKSQKLIVVLDRKPLGSTKTAIEREYISRDDLEAAIMGQLGITAEELRRIYPIYKATSYAREKADLDRWTGRNAGRFFDLVVKLRGSIDPIEVGASIPSQQPAPLMFDSFDDVVGLAHTAAVGAAPAQVKGAAKSLTHQAQDLLALPALENAVPRSAIRISRVVTILDRLARGESADEADVVELGVEISAFEGSVHGANERIGDFTLVDVLVFLEESHRLLGRFPVWLDYARGANKKVPPHTARHLTESAHSILKAAADERFVSAEAADRIKETTGPGGGEIGDLHRQGLTLSAENFAAAAGRSALRAVKASTGQLGRETKNKVVNNVADLAARFLLQHAGPLLQIAEAQGHRWLEMLLKSLSNSG